MKPAVIVVGGGAAGYFGAICCAEQQKRLPVILLEATHKPLTKVRISGGGRCNVTHHCFDPARLTQNYPRGARELRGAFSKFQPQDTVRWFASRGVELKAEADGRMFPATNSSQTIVDCLEQAAARAGVQIKLGAKVEAIVASSATDEGRWQIVMKDGSRLAARSVLLSTGSAPLGYQLAGALGHTIEPLVPSLFTFNCKDPRLADLGGVAFSAAGLRLPLANAGFLGPLLITHWGLSGPAVLKLSSFAAAQLHAAKYQAELEIDFVPERGGTDAVTAALRAYKDANPRQSVSKNGPFVEVPRRFWARLVEVSQLSETATYAELPKTKMNALVTELCRGRYAIAGKGVFKEEFVTAGGVQLTEIDWRTLGSRLHPGIHFAGEILNVDGITGGFNFQAAWTTSWIAGGAMAADC